MVPTGRIAVDGQPRPMYTASGPCTLSFWVSSRKIEDDFPTVVFVQWSKELATLSSGTPLEEGIKYEFPMEKGDTLWAVTEKLALMGFVVMS